MLMRRAPAARSDMDRTLASSCESAWSQTLLWLTSAVTVMDMSPSSGCGGKYYWRAGTGQSPTSARLGEIRRELVACPGLALVDASQGLDPFLRGTCSLGFATHLLGVLQRCVQACLRELLLTL